MAKKRIFSVKAIKEKKYQYLELEPKYAHLMGEPAKRFVALFYGESGSGKSVFTLQFADYFARNFGKVLYNSHEEGANKTIQDRVNNFDIDAKRLWIADSFSFDEMCHYIEKNYYRLIIIDSVKYMSFTNEQLKRLKELFAKRQLSIVMIDFGKALGSPASGIDLLHASDIKLYFKRGSVHAISRYLDQPVKYQLFTPQSADKRQLTLF
ncbi:ATPase domain-containing protein [Dysgonomonas sp. ZJ279]|uniref:ATPase domain-containing protein n=1 Tax=Dysgonomonas sp. ZJ279 TaxID=2709796 RepID=UPI0013EA6292|nr:ATPase domain-containing protein [Dysgonomonas sp. ZJ279]